MTQYYIRDSKSFFFVLLYTHIFYKYMSDIYLFFNI